MYLGLFDPVVSTAVSSLLFQFPLHPCTNQTNLTSLYPSAQYTQAELQHRTGDYMNIKTEFPHYSHNFSSETAYIYIYICTYITK